MKSSKTRTAKLRNGSSPNSRVHVSLVEALRGRLEVITGRINSRYMLSLVCASRSYPELIRRYSNDSML